MNKAKKISWLLILLISVGLTSCVSLQQEPVESSNYTAKSKLVTPSDVIIPSDANVTVYFVNDHYRERSILESIVVEHLQQAGINALSVTNTYLDRSDLEDFNAWDATVYMGGNHIISIWMDSFYTYTNGGGASFIQVHTDIQNDIVPDPIVRINSDVKAIENTFDSYLESLDQMYPILGASIASEIIKLVK